MKQQSLPIQFLMALMILCLSHFASAQCPVTVTESGGTLSASSAGTAPFAYIWTTGDFTANITPSGAGTYCCTVTDNNGCSSIGCYTTTSGVCSTTITQGSSDELNATTTGVGPFTYIWNTTNTTATISGLVNGSYCVTVTDLTGCISSDCLSVTVPACGMTISEASGVLTAGASGTAPYVYQWNTGEITSSITSLTSGNYCVTITDATGCASWGCYNYNAACAATVAESGGVLTANSSGAAPFTYSWNDGSNSMNNTITLPSLYCCTITDVNGCTSTGCYDASSTCSSTISQTGIEELTITPNGTAPYAYLWSTGQVTATLTGLVSGTYCVTTTDATGCVSSDCASINVSGCTATLSYSGSTLTAVSSGTGPFAYSWTDGSSLNTYNVGMPGAYCCTITDANGCSGVGCYVVTGGICDVTITETAGDELTGSSTGMSPFTYAWSNGENTATITGITAGNYCVTITDNTGCAAMNCYNYVGVSCGVSLAQTTNTITATATGIAPFAYLWDDGSASNYITGLTSGTSYCVTVVDANGCFSDACLTYQNMVPCEANFLITFNPATPDTIYAIEGSSASSGSTIVSWAWDFGDGSVSTAQYPSNYYGSFGAYFLCLTIVDDLGCTSSYCDTIGVDSNGTYLGKTEGGFNLSVVSEAPIFSTVRDHGSNKVSVQLFPNPVTDVLHLQIDSDKLMNNSSINISSINGQLVYQQTIANNMSSLNATINTSKFNPGMYILEYSTRNELKRLRFIKTQ